MPLTSSRKAQLGLSTQPRNSRREVDETRQFDKTSLRMSKHGQWIDRDYAAHFFKWGFTSRFIDKRAKVLDVGCGTDCPLSRLLISARYQSCRPAKYLGVDFNRKPRYVPGYSWATFMWEFDFTSRYYELGQFDVVVCLEVIEHMRRPDGLRLLRGIRECLRPGGTALVSTPVFNGKAAAHHLYEWEVGELTDAITSSGMEVTRRFGTFASIQEIRRAMTVEHREVLDALSAYYSNEVLSCFMAPLYPDASRNNLWVCRATTKFRKP